MRFMRFRTFCKFTGFITIVCVGFYFLQDRNLQLNRIEEISRVERSILSPINRGECVHPILRIDNPEIMKFYKPAKKLKCGNPLDDWVMCERSICFVKPEINSSHGDVICSYTDLIRKTDFRVKYGRTTKTKEPYVLQESDFVKVVCLANNSKTWSGMAFGIRDGVTITPKTFNYKHSSLIKKIDNAYDSKHFNILMFGFDSLSRHAFIRKLPKTYEYLTKNLDAQILNGYNIVGDGTPQALIPILTGYTELELPDTRKRGFNSFNVDVYPMIWKEYEKHGYVTSFNEDTPNVGIFTYRLKGFYKQPVDHYLRTYYVEASNIWSDSKEFCIGHQPDHIVMLNYTKNFMHKYTDVPNFIFSFHGGLSHDDINQIGIADDDVVDWLTDIKNRKLLDNTILIFMSDHGNRFADVRATLQGKQEERLPFFSFAFPDNFKQRFPNEYANFQKNTDKLTTPFDIHSTLKHILSLQNEQMIDDMEYVDDTSENNIDLLATNLANERAISLLDSIPKNRSCADAYIEPHWCACLQWQQLDIKTAKTDVKTYAMEMKVLKMAKNIVDTINDATKQYRHLCETLILDDISWVMQLIPNKDMLNFKKSNDADGFNADLSDIMSLKEEIYQLQIILNPGKSIFEATVSYNLRYSTITSKLTEISRINKYGSQANCIYERNPEIRKYCYCKT